MIGGARTDQRRIIAGPRNTNFDRYIADLVRDRGYGFERVWHGVDDQHRADQLRRRLKQAGRHLGISVKAYWLEISGCPLSGGKCPYHVYYTAYDKPAARAYKRQRLLERTRDGQ